MTLLPLWRCQWLGAVGSQAHWQSGTAGPWWTSLRVPSQDWPSARLMIAFGNNPGTAARYSSRSARLWTPVWQCLPDGQTNYCTDFMGSPLLSRLAGLLSPPVQDACYAQASPPHPRRSAEPAEDRLCPTPVEVAPAQLKVFKVQKINNLSIPTQSQIHRGLTTVTRTPRELENSRRRCLIVYPSFSKAILCNF